MTGILCGLMIVAAAPPEKDSAKAVVDKAVQAMGGEKKLADGPAFTFKTTGFVMLAENRIDVDGEWSVQGLTQYRWEGDLNPNNRVTIIFGGGKGCLVGKDGKATDFPDETSASAVASFRGFRFAQNPLLLRDKGVELTYLGESKLVGRDAVVLKVVRKGQADVDLYFDKKTGLPCLAEMRLKEGKDGGEVKHAYHFDEFKDFGGIKHFGKVVFERDGTKTVELECSEVKPQFKLDESLFVKPKN